MRDGLVRQRTAIVNRVRGLLAEQGIVLAAGIGRFRRLVRQEYERVRALDRDIKDLDRDLGAASQADVACQRLQAIPGLGLIGTTALRGAVGDGQQAFVRDFVAAWDKVMNLDRYDLG